MTIHALSKVCWRGPQPAIKIRSRSAVALQQTMLSMAKPAGQSLGRRSANRTLDPYTISPAQTGGPVEVGKPMLAPRHPPFPQVSAYGESILQRPANTYTANPYQQTPPRGLLATRGVCCG